MRSFALGVSAVVVSAFVVGTAGAADAPKSGPQVGAFATPFDVRDITGPSAGDTLCYR